MAIFQNAHGDTASGLHIISGTQPSDPASFAFTPLEFSQAKITVDGDTVSMTLPNGYSTQDPRQTFMFFFK